MINEHRHENFLNFLALEENKKKAGGSEAEVASLRAGQAGGKEFKVWSTHCILKNTDHMGITKKWSKARP